MDLRGGLDLVFVWHMHQPDYRDHGSGEFVLPWVYLHATKDYTDMVAHLERHPKIRAVVNFVPVLLDQIEDYATQFAAANIRDPLLRLLAHPDMDALRPEERRFLLDACFRSNHVTMVQPYPRYKRLHELLKTLEAQGEAALSYLSGAFYADLITWYHLVWIGETERRSRPILAELLSKGEGFTRADRLHLFNLIGELISGLLPRYRALAAEGRIELSATPHTHPLSPLLLDLAVARESEPAISLPKAEAYPGGRARVSAQIASALASHSRRFGVPCTGMWPAEGAISSAFVKLMESQGVRWAATSEAVLVNSLRRQGELPQRGEYLYRAYRSQAAPGLVLYFRDEALSDLIGFEYAKWHGRDAANDFITRLEGIQRDAAESSGSVVSVILDGENAWEYYPYNGYYFFDDLYSGLEEHPTIRTTTYQDRLASGKEAPGELSSIVAGSWVYGTLTTWIGNPDKNRAWDLLCAAKQTYDLVMASGRLGAEERVGAEKQLSICESSDWFWWFGDYNPQQAVASFDRLFRQNLSRLYELLRLPPPSQLGEPISRGSGAPESGGAMRRAS